MTATISVSVVIPCYNEENYLRDLLDDLSKQTIRPKQIIVADSRSTDSTVTVAEQYAQKLPIAVVTSSIRSPGAARNAGAHAAVSDYILFSDADNRMPPDAIERFTRAAATEQVDYVTPLFASPSKRWFPQRTMRGINKFLVDPATPERFIPGIGGCMFVRRKLHETTGGFDTELATAEDMLYLKELKRRGATYTVLQDLYIETSDRRFEVDGALLILLHFIPRDWWVGSHLVYPILKKLNKDKQYGMF